MNRSKKVTLMGAALGLAMVGSVNAANIAKSGAISVSETWTADNVYNLVGQVYVTNGATLTIEAGTKILSNPADQGSLAITRGSKIVAIGTANNPIVFSSTNENGTARVAANEWGNITIMGKGLIGAEYNAKGTAVRTYQDGAGAPVVSNTATPTGLNKAVMEGLTAAFAGDPDVLYGGNNDNDDSGTLAYVSLRNGGKVAGLGNELNGLSLGAIGRETDIHHIDIYNNVDDGIEIWGGTVNLKYFSIWNIGDDSIDVDQGWRGKAQFGLIVQGYSVVANNASLQGSGAGDNAFETDGAEANNSVPATTGTVYNVTIVGQPDGQFFGVGDGSDRAFEFRDNARMQYRNMLVMNTGEQVVKEGDSEGGATLDWRYGQGAVAPFNTTPPFTNAADGVWGLPYTAAWDTAQAEVGGHPSNADYLGVAGPMSSSALQQLYAAQSAGNAAGQGYLCELTDSLLYNNKHASAYSTSNSVGVTSSGASNPSKGIVVQSGAATLPIKALTYGTVTDIDLTGGNLFMANVTQIDPRRNTANADTVSLGTAPIDGFFTPVQYRGGFSDDVNWCVGWTAADEYGLFTGAANPADPTATVQVTSLVGFATEVGKTYSVEESTDGKTWSPVAVIEGDGSTKYYADVAGLTAGKLYRAIAQ